MSKVWKSGEVATFIADKEWLKPKRATRGSAGYDFCAPKRVVVPAHGSVVFGTGVRSVIREGFVLKLYIRSSLGLKHRIRLTNSVAIIDSDYTDEIKGALTNDSDEDYIIEPGERYMQGIFERYYRVEDDSVITSRTGGVGSTGK